MGPSDLRAAKAWARDRPGVSAVYEGFKYTGGRRTTTRAVVVAVERKRPRAEVPEAQLVPQAFGALPSDVVEGRYEALSLTARRRPCAAGYSMGHLLVTAGTFGLPVKRGTDEVWYALTNNHVAAASNAGRPGDRILQPGKADGGQDPADWWASLVEYVEIGFEGAERPKKDKRVGRLWWAAVRGVGNLGARLARCPYRVRVGPLAVEQPRPNLVDAALCRPAVQSALLPEVHGLGPVLGVRDLILGDQVQKVGRTTELTAGTVEGVNGAVSVSYGDAGTALYDDQVIIRSTAGEFSAGGDSGSAILTLDGFVGGLLFAGGGGQTVACKFSHVQALLGVRVA